MSILVKLCKNDTDTNVVLYVQRNEERQSGSHANVTHSVQGQKYYLKLKWQRSLFTCPKASFFQQITTQTQQVGYIASQSCAEMTYDRFYIHILRTCFQAC